jgi:hypothetical protein
MQASRDESVQSLAFSVQRCLAAARSLLAVPRLCGSLVIIDAARFLRLLAAKFKSWSRNRSKEWPKIRASFLYF